MDKPVFSKDPPRLVDEGGAVGRLIESAEPAFHGGISVHRSWRRLEQQRQGRGRLRAFRVLPVGLAVALAAAGAIAWLRPEHKPVPLALTAEPVVPSAHAAPPETPRPAEHALEPQPTAPTPLLIANGARRSLLEEAPASDAACRALAKSKPDRAVDCFLALSAGNGVEAEVALYEALRLNAGELHNPARALELAEQYHARYPDGAMRGEVAWVRVQSLDRAGRSDEALRESEALLGTPLGRALAPKLHLLRGHIFGDERNDCASAVSEFVSLVGAPGADADAAELARAKCLESLGQLPDARTAYQQYLRRTDARDAAHAASRLAALTAELAAKGAQ